MIILSIAAMLLPAIDRDPSPRAPSSQKKKCRTLLQAYPAPEPGRMQKLEMPRGEIIFAALNSDDGCVKPIMASQTGRGQR